VEDDRPRALRARGADHRRDLVDRRPLALPDFDAAPLVQRPEVDADARMAAGTSKLAVDARLDQDRQRAFGFPSGEVGLDRREDVLAHHPVRWEPTLALVAEEGVGARGPEVAVDGNPGSGDQTERLLEEARRVAYGGLLRRR